MSLPATGGRTIAALGGEPAFETPLHVAQVNLPPWEDVEQIFRGIFDRRYFANHGPLTRELDSAFAEAAGVQHAVCVTNGTVALMLLARALDLQGEVIVPAFTFPATIQALQWAGLEPVLCDVDPGTHMISAGIVEPLITARTCGVLGVHVWGRACDPDGLEALCDRRGLALMFDACHAVGSTHRGVPIGGFGAGEAFSFHATKVLNGGEGGCITTNDAGLAARLRTIRNFHPGETFVPVPTRMNGKMSEAQAALALLSLRQLPASIEANRRRHAAYAAVLGEVPGLELLQYDPGEANSHQYVVVEIDPELSGLDRDVLLTALQAENILCRRHFYPGLHRMPPFAAAGQTLPVTDRLCRRLLQLPNSQSMTVEDATRVGETILSIHASREALRARA